jgi:hypothetical protein
MNLRCGWHGVSERRTERAEACNSPLDSDELVLPKLEPLKWRRNSRNGLQASNEGQEQKVGVASSTENRSNGRQAQKAGSEPFYAVSVLDSSSDSPSLLLPSQEHMASAQLVFGAPLPQDGYGIGNG